MKETKLCPHCGKEILKDAKKCRYCKEWLVNEESQEIDAKAIRHFSPDNSSNGKRQLQGNNFVSKKTLALLGPIIFFTILYIAFITNLHKNHFYECVYEVVGSISTVLFVFLVTIHYLIVDKGFQKTTANISKLYMVLIPIVGILLFGILYYNLDNYYLWWMSEKYKVYNNSSYMLNFDDLHITYSLFILFIWLLLSYYIIVLVVHKIKTREHLSIYSYAIGLASMVIGCLMIFFVMTQSLSTEQQKDSKTFEPQVEAGEKGN
jgi:hypothetical protein